jgi:hypothetical protein
MPEVCVEAVDVDLVGGRRTDMSQIQRLATNLQPLRLSRLSHPFRKGFERISAALEPESAWACDPEGRSGSVPRARTRGNVRVRARVQWLGCAKCL